MKFALASYGTRGDIEPCAAVGRELLRRGHDVRLAVPPDLIGFVEAAGLEAVDYGLETHGPLEAQRKLWTTLLRGFWRVRDLAESWRGVWQLAAQCRDEVNTTLVSIADGADLLVTGLVYEEAAANVAEYYGIPLATLHYFPMRANGHLHPRLPARLNRSAMRVNEWFYWRRTKKLEDAQRRQLGLSETKEPAPQRFTERGSLEIQAYDEACFPGLAAEWATWNGQRPFVGTLTMELPTESDDDVASWVAAGKPPIYFGFGSIPVESPAETVAMIAEVCAHLGERALIGAGWSNFNDVPQYDHVKIVAAVNFATTFPACRAVVHHGGAATTVIGLRAGVPTLVLWTNTDPIQSIWGAQVKRLKVGYSRRFSATTPKSLLADLRRILSPEYAIRAREISTRMVKPGESVANAADLLEKFAHQRRVT